MATLNAIKQLGKSIAKDLRDAKDSVAASIDRARTERAVMRDFKVLLREHPVQVAKAFKTITEAEDKPAKKPRAKKPATA